MMAEQTESTGDPPAADASSVAGTAVDASSISADAAAVASGGPAAPVDAAQPAANASAVSPIIDEASIDELLKAATFDDPGAVGPAADVAASAVELPSFAAALDAAPASSIDLLRDVDLNVKIELGRSRMLVEDVLRLGEGSVVELDKLAGDPVDVFVNERLVARGEVLVLNDNFCVRINEIVAATREEGL
jgi:flagellar motor switch protein FliN/FliY